MILPPFVGAIGLRQIFGQYGAINAALTWLHLLPVGDVVDWLGRWRFGGIVLLNALHLYPILLLNLTAALANVDPAAEEAAENLGCTGWRKFRRITLPLILPGFFAGGILVFIFAFTELGVPLMFDYSRVTSVQIFYGIKEIAGNPFPFALVTIMLVTTAVLYVVSRWIAGRADYAQVTKASAARFSATNSRGAGWLCTIFVLGVIALALLPHVGVILIAFAGSWYRTVFPASWTFDHFTFALGHPLAVPSILNSVKYAACSTGIDVVLGLAIAYVLVRSRVPGRWLLDTLSMLPLAVPGLVLAFGYISITQEGQPLAALNPTRDPTLLLIIAYSVRRLPYVVRSAAAGLQQTSATLEEAAANLGAPPWRVLGRITMPLVAANLIAGALLAFSFAMLEVSDSLVLAQRQQHFPITKAIYELFQLLGEGRYVASALGVWAMAFLTLTLLCANRLLGRRLGALFRG
jgi:iron(III) transport system permease protein